MRSSIQRKKKVQLSRNQLSELDRIVSLEQELYTCKYQLTKISAQVDLMFKWIRKECGEEFRFGILDRVVLDIMQKDVVQRTSVVSNESTVNLMGNILDSHIIDDQNHINSNEQQDEGVGVRDNESHATSEDYSTESCLGKRKGLKGRKKKLKSYIYGERCNFDEIGNKYYTCGMKCCNKRFKFNSELKQHLKRFTNNKPYTCTWKNCTKSFCTKAEVKSHLIVHTDRKDFKCDESNCGKAFAQKVNLINHKRLHTGEKPFSCSFCSASFTFATSLSYHIPRSHTKERPFRCEICDKSFVAISNRSIHKKRYHLGH